MNSNSRVRRWFKLRFKDIPEEEAQKIEAATRTMLSELMSEGNLRAEDVLPFALVELV